MEGIEDVRGVKEKSLEEISKEIDANTWNKKVIFFGVYFVNTGIVSSFILK